MCSAMDNGRSQGASSVLPEPVRIHIRSLNEKIIATTIVAASITVHWALCMFLYTLHITLKEL